MKTRHMTNFYFQIVKDGDKWLGSCDVTVDHDMLMIENIQVEHGAETKTYNDMDEMAADFPTEQCDSAIQQVSAQYEGEIADEKLRLIEGER